MGFKRLMIQDGGFTRNARAGDNFINPAMEVVAADAADSILVNEMQQGIIQYTSFSAGRILTTDTAANILAAMPELDVGDSFTFIVSCVAAFAGTYAAGAGVTLAGRATTPASSWSMIVVTKTSGTTVTWTVL